MYPFFGCCPYPISFCRFSNITDKIQILTYISGDGTALDTHKNPLSPGNKDQLCFLYTEERAALEYHNESMVKVSPCLCRVGVLWRTKVPIDLSKICGAQEVYED